MTSQDMFLDASRRVQTLDLGDVVAKHSFDPLTDQGGYPGAATTLLFATKLARQDAHNHAAILDAVYKIVEVLA